MVRVTSIPVIEGLEDFDSTTIYNVDANVGPGATNDRADVMLVQFFLKQIADPSWSAGLKAIEPDGYFGPITASWIKRFQESVKSIAKTPILVDNYVDPANRFGVALISNTIYTIVYLNDALFEADEQLFIGLATDQRTPSFLRFKLTGVDPDLEPPPSPNPLPPPPPPPIQ